jgi:hypothetical protein
VKNNIEITKTDVSKMTKSLIESGNLPEFFFIRVLKRFSATISRRSMCSPSVRDFALSTFTASSANSVSQAD